MNNKEQYKRSKIESLKAQRMHYEEREKSYRLYWNFNRGFLIFIFVFFTLLPFIAVFIKR